MKLRLFHYPKPLKSYVNVSLAVKPRWSSQTRDLSHSGESSRSTESHTARARVAMEESVGKGPRVLLLPCLPCAPLNYDYVL
jgi:hypothetical protein